MATTITNKQIIEHVSTMTALELKELVSMIETTFGVTAAVAAAPAAAEAVETKSSTVSFILKGLGASKVAVIKAIGVAIGKGLLDSKKIADLVAAGTPQVIKSDLNESDAKILEEAFKTAGAEFEIK